MHLMITSEHPMADRNRVVERAGKHHHHDDERKGDDDGFVMLLDGLIERAHV